jgi:methyl-accepting chemotaxis protein
MSVKFKVIALSVISIVFSSILIAFIAIKSFDDTLEEGTYEQLENLAGDKKEFIQEYFGLYESLLKTWSNSRFAVKSLHLLSDSFYKLEDEVSGIDGNHLQQKLIEHYDDHYLNKVNYQLQNISGRRLTSQYLPKDRNGQIAQKLFILDNEHKIGEKNRLTTPKDHKDLSYAKAHKMYHSTYNTILEEYDLYDIFLINLKGDIVYSTYKEKDFGTNLRKDIYKLSNLGRAYFKALRAKEGEAVFEDFDFYEPSFNSPASFIASPIYEDGVLVGVMAFQIPIEKMNNMVRAEKNSTLGDSGEVYLIGRDYKMRTDSRFIPQIQDKIVQSSQTTISTYEIRNRYVELALSGEGGIGVHHNYLGTEVLIAYKPIDMFGSQWAVIAEISKKEAFKEGSELVKTLSIISLIIIIIAIAVMLFFIDRYMSTPLNNLIETAKSLASDEGDLTQRLPIQTDDEFGTVSKNINDFIERIQGLINNIKDLADENIKIAGSLSSSTENISKRIESENKNLLNISDNGKNISSNLRETTHNIKETKVIIVDSNEILITAKNEITELAEKVSETSTTQKELSNKLANLSSNAEKIKEVLIVIDDIADQTNLLALNAAIEAARAGEYGRGFAVVAYEVTKLAEKTQESLTDVNKIVSYILDEIKDSVNQMNRSADGISELSTVSSDASRRIVDTSNNIESSVKVFEDTVSGAVEASEKTSEIIEKIQQITTMSNENTKSISDMSQMSNHLSDTGASLNEQLESFKS